MANVRMYSLSTCHHCRRAKSLLTALGVPFTQTDVDLLSGPQREAALEQVRRLNPECSFPTIVIDGEVIVGADEAKIRQALGV